MKGYLGSKLIFEGSLSRITVDASGPSSLTFTLSPVATADGKGGIDVTITLPAGHAVDSVSASIDGVLQTEGLSFVKAEKTISFTKTAVTSGNRLLSFDLKNSAGTTIANVPELARVYDFLSSKGTIVLLLSDFNSAPSTPEALEVQLVEGSQGAQDMVVSWTRKSNNETGFLLDTGASEPVAVAGDSTSYTLNGVTLGQAYSFKIKAVNGFGDSAFSSVVTATANYSYALIDGGAAYQLSSYAGSESAIVIPSSFNGKPVNAIGNRAFSGKTGLTSISFEANSTLKTIGEAAFKDTSISTLAIPDSVTSIGDYALANNSKLLSVTLGSGTASALTSIGQYAFSSCPLLAEVSIYKATVPTLGSGAFDDNASDRKLHVPLASIDTYKAASNWSTYASTIDSISTPVADFTWTLLSNPSRYRIAAYSGSDRSIIVPSTYLGLPVREIGTALDTAATGVFSKEKLGFRITSVSIPASIVSIGACAFQDANLGAVTIPDSVLAIKHSAFYTSTGQGYSNVTSLTLGSGLATLDANAFFNTAITEVVLPASVTAMNEGVFSQAQSLVSVTIKATTPPSGVDSNTFYGSGAGLKIYVPSANMDAYKAAAGWSGYSAKILAATGSFNVAVGLNSAGFFQVVNDKTMGFWNGSGSGNLEVPTQYFSGYPMVMTNNGTDIYVAGQVQPANSSPDLPLADPGYWLNGKWNPLTPMYANSYTQVSGIAILEDTVAGSATVFLGNEAEPYYWMKNISGDITSVKLPIPKLDADSGGYATGFNVSNGKFYISGYIFSDAIGGNHICYWVVDTSGITRVDCKVGDTYRIRSGSTNILVDGTAIYLPGEVQKGQIRVAGYMDEAGDWNYLAEENSTTTSEAYGVSKWGDSVYFGGVYSYHKAYWKKTGSTLTRRSFSQLDGMPPVLVYAIGSDVYLVGNDSRYENGNYVRGAGYLKDANGTSSNAEWILQTPPTAVDMLEVRTALYIPAAR